MTSEPKDFYSEWPEDDAPQSYSSGAHERIQNLRIENLHGRVSTLESMVRHIDSDVSEIKKDVKTLLKETAHRDGEAHSIRLFWGGAVAIPGWLLAILQFLRS